MQLPLLTNIIVTVLLCGRQGMEPNPGLVRLNINLKGSFIASTQEFKNVKYSGTEGENSVSRYDDDVPKT